jgi:hypothetical protein
LQAAAPVDLLATGATRDQINSNTESVAAAGKKEVEMRLTKVPQSEAKESDFFDFLWTQLLLTMWMKLFIPADTI